MLKNKHHVYGESVEIPSHLHFGQLMLDKMMENQHNVALVNSDTGDSITYGQLAQKTVNVALSLTRIGVRKGDVISISIEKSFEVMSTILGIFCAGATFSPTDITYGTVPLIHRVKIARPKIMFCSSVALELRKSAFDSVGCIQTYIVYNDDPKSKPQLDKPNIMLYKDFLTETASVDDFLPTPVGFEDFLLILFSSGTTGLPKGVPWTHLGFIINSISLTNESFKGQGLLITREWYYTYGLLYTLGGLRGGATIVYSYKNTHEDCLKAIQNYKIKYLQLTPSSVLELIKSPILDQFDVSSLEGIVSSSTPIKAEQVQAIKKRLGKLRGVFQLYGLSEAGAACTELHAALGPRSGSAGTPSHGFVFKVVDLKTRQALGPGVRGEICFKSPSLTPGYLGVPNRDHLDSEGFYKTGDVGYYDDDHYFYVVGRLKEMIKYNDISIAPAELESILLEHPAVKEVGIVGAPSEEWGEAPTAFVVLQPGGEATEGELVEFLESRITYRMRLAGGVRFLQALPRGAGDKLNRDALKKLL